MEEVCENAQMFQVALVSRFFTLIGHRPSSFPKDVTINVNGISPNNVYPGMWNRLSISKKICFKRGPSQQSNLTAGRYFGDAFEKQKWESVVIKCEDVFPDFSNGLLLAQRFEIFGRSTHKCIDFLSNRNPKQATSLFLYCGNEIWHKLEQKANATVSEVHSSHFSFFLFQFVPRVPQK